MGGRDQEACNWRHETRSRYPKSSEWDESEAESPGCSVGSSHRTFLLFWERAVEITFWVSVCSKPLQTPFSGLPPVLVFDGNRDQGRLTGPEGVEPVGGPCFDWGGGGRRVGSLNTPHTE